MGSTPNGYGYSCNHVTFYQYVVLKIVYNLESYYTDIEFVVM